MVIMTLITNVAIAELVPHLAASGETVFKVPRPGGGSMEMLEHGRDVLQRLDAHHKVVVVGQDDPPSELCLAIGQFRE